MSSYRSFGLLGLIVLLFGLLAGMITFEWTSFYVLVHLILGAVMLSLYLFTHLDTLQESVAGRRAKHATNTIVYTLITIAVIGIINYLGVQHPTRYDATATGIFSLAPQTEQLLANLQEEVSVHAFFREGEDAAARDLLASYDVVSDRFAYEFSDPDKRPELAEEFEITEYGTLVVSSGSENTRVNETTEEALTNALLRVTNAGVKRLYFVTGHGEPDIEAAETVDGYGQLKAALENEGYEVMSLVLGSLPDVPGDSDLLMVAGPQRPFLERELEALGRYLRRGGKGAFFLEPQQSPELAALMREFGVEVGDDVIVEQYVQLFGGAQLGIEPIIGNYGGHAITTDFQERTIFRVARSVSPADETADGVTVTALANTSNSSWAETDIDRLFGSGEVGLDDADVEGPLSIAVAARFEESALQWTEPLIASLPDAEVSAGTLDDESDGAEPADDSAPATDLEGRIVVVGDAEWVNNRYLSLYFNEDLFLNAVGWLAGEEDLISIRPRATRASRVVLTATESQAVFYLAVLLLPEMILFAGLIIWRSRRR